MKLARQVLFLIKEGYEFKTLKDNKLPLTPEEREEVMNAKAVWHHGPNGKETPAISKAEVRGKTIYFTYTHRAFDSAPTLKGAIKCFHDFIKETA